MKLFKTRNSRKLEGFEEPSDEAASEEPPEAFTPPERLLSHARQMREQAAGLVANGHDPRTSLRVAELDEMWAAMGGFPGDIFLIGRDDAILQQLLLQEDMASREKWKEQMRKYGHRKMSLCNWEENDLEWLLELQSRNDLPEFLQIYHEDTGELEHVSSAEQIRRLQHNIPSENTGT